MIEERVVELVAVDRDGRAYRSGWQDGRFGSTGTFAVNENLATWEDFDRLTYYRGHREGRRVKEMLRMGAQVAETA